MFPLPLFYYFEIGAFIISIIFLPRIRNTPLIWCIPFLGLMIIVELTGRYIKKIIVQPNSWLFNFTIPIEYFFYFFLIYSFCLTKKYRKTIKFMAFSLAVSSLINILFIQGPKDLNTLTLKLGTCLMIFSSGLGLIDLFKNDEHVSLIRNPLFWICTGVLFFNAGGFFYFFFLDILIKNKWDETAMVFTSINDKLIYVLYTCISIAIVCLKKSEKKV